MKSHFFIPLLLALVGLWQDTARAADAKPSWQTAWEKTLAAAKKEGKLNFYVGRYGSEPLLNEFRARNFPRSNWSRSTDRATV